MPTSKSIARSVAKLPSGPAANPVADNCPKTAAAAAEEQSQAKRQQADLKALKAVPPKTKPPIPCKYVSSVVTDAQGRKPGPDGSLYVVPEVTHSVTVGKASSLGMAYARGISAASESINASGTFTGGCADHAAWLLATPASNTVEPGGAAILDAPAIRPEKLSLPYQFPFSTSRLQPMACEGREIEYTIYTVAGDSVEFEFDTDKIKLPFNNALARTFKLDSDNVERKKKAETTGKFKIKQAWKEDKASHRAYCQTQFDVALDPLFKLSDKYLLYGLPIPGKVKKYLEAGLYLGLSLGAKLHADLVMRSWADDRQWSAESGGLSGDIKAKGSLSVDLTLIDPEIIGVELSGETSLTGTLALTSKAKGVRLSAKWSGLTASVKVSLLDGWIEIDKDWTAFEDTEPLQHDWPIESLFGPAPAYS